jgi:hypothetical protein
LYVCGPNNSIILAHYYIGNASLLDPSNQLMEPIAVRTDVTSSY